MLDYVRIWGDRTSPTVVLLHPAGGTRHSWTPHAEALEDDYHVVAVDLPAHGVHPLGEFRFDRAVEDVGSILDDVGSATLAGHSQGGYVAVRAAATHADRVDGLLLAGAAYDWRKPKLVALTAVYYPLSYVLEAVSYSDRLSEWVAGRLRVGDDPRQEPPDGEDTRGYLYGTAKSIRAGFLQRTSSYAEEYDGPLPVAHGEDEPFGDHPETFAARADAQLEWYEGGHQAPMVNTEEFTRFVRDFLGDRYRERETTSRMT